MKLQGSCYCGAVHFSVLSPHPYPYMHCYCDICRKTAGGGGFAINLGATAASLEVTGEVHIRMFHARIDDGEGGECQSPGERRFCGQCGSALWVWDPRWPELVHPFASAIDTPLPAPPERYHIFQRSKPDWVALPRAAQEQCFATYPAGTSLADWHRQWGLESPVDD